MKKIIGIVESLEDSSLLPEGVSETIENRVKGQRRGFLSMLLVKLGASLLGNILTGWVINRAREEVTRASYDIKKTELKKTKKEQQKDKIMKTEWIFNAASSFN